MPDFHLGKEWRQIQNRDRHKACPCRETTENVRLEADQQPTPGETATKTHDQHQLARFDGTVLTEFI